MKQFGQYTRREFACVLLAANEENRTTKAKEPVTTKAEWQTLRRSTLAGMQEVMGPLPKSPADPPEMKVVEEYASERWIRRRITFSSGDGDAVPAWLFTPRSRNGRHRAALCLHQTTATGKAEPAGLGGKPNLHYALELAERGFVTLAPDYPKFGDYQTNPYSMGYVSTTMKGVRNHRRAVDLLCSLPNVSPRRIAAIGHSLGGHNALFLAAFDPRVQVVVTSCGFTSFAKYYGGDLAGWSHAGYMPRIASVYGKDPAKVPFDFPAILQSLAPRPLFINAPLRDSNFDVSGVDDCVRAAQDVYRRVFRTSRRIQVEHPDCGHDFPPEIRTAAYDFMMRML